jgi:hypothetical protein
MDLVQFIKLIGSEAVTAALEKIAAAQSKVGDSAGKVANETKKGIPIFGELSSKVVGFVSAWGGFTTVLNMLSK